MLYFKSHIKDTVQVFYIFSVKILSQILPMCQILKLFSVCGEQ